MVGTEQEIWSNGSSSTTSGAPNSLTTTWKEGNQLTNSKTSFFLSPPPWVLDMGRRSKDGFYRKWIVYYRYNNLILFPSSGPAALMSSSFFLKIYWLKSLYLLLNEMDGWIPWPLLAGRERRMLDVVKRLWDPGPESMMCVFFFFFLHLDFPWRKNILTNEWIKIQGHSTECMYYKLVIWQTWVQLKKIQKVQ